MTTTVVTSGNTANAVILNSGDILNVLSGGSASNTVVNASGNENVSGAVTSTTVNNGGTESLSSGSTATGTVVNGGGAQLVHTGATAQSTTVNGVGNQYVDGTVVNTVVNSGGIESLFNSSVANGTVVNTGGSVSVGSGSTISGIKINSGGTVSLLTGGIVSGGILFSGDNATLHISGPTMPATTISGLTSTDAIDLTDLAFAPSNTATVSGNTVVVTSAGGVTDTLTIAGAPHDTFALSRVSSTDGGTKLMIVSAVGNPVVSSTTVTVAGNAAATAIGFAAPTDPNFSAAQLTITADTLPSDGSVTLADGTTVVTAGEVLTITQLTGLLFKPAAGQFATSSAFTYTVTDPSTNASNGTATLAISRAVGNPVVVSPTITVAGNSTATAIGIAAPTDPNYTATQLTITAGTLPTDGTVTLADGVTAVTAGQTLTAAQLTGLLFKPTTGQFSTSSAFTYTVTDPSSNASTGTATLAIGPGVGNPMVSSPTITVAENAVATAIGIAAPTDPNFSAAQLTIAADTLPTDGTVTLADGVTAVTSGQTLTSAQLTGLLFKPTTGQFATRSAFTYTVTDPSSNASTGTATLAISRAVGNPIVFSPTVTVAENAVATAIGIAAPTDPNYSAAQLTIVAGTLPADGTVTLADGVTAVTVEQTLTAAQLTGLLFKPTTGQFSTNSAFTYTVIDPSSNTNTGTATLAIGAAIGNPVVASPTVTVAENAAATAIGIAAPSDPNYSVAQLTITAGNVPGDGAVTLADGTTAVVTGQALTSAQLTGLLFTPTHGQFATSSTFTYSVTDPSSNASTGTATFAIGPATGARVPSDFNGDGKSDLVLQNDNGAMVIDVLNGLSVPAAISVGNPGPTWHIMGSADFNGDGQADLLLQNDNGTVVDYLMNGTSIASGAVLGTPGSSVHVRGMGDFTRDGSADILVQSDSGAMTIWETNGATVTSTASVGSLPAGWTVEGVADFNGDGTPDILVQNTNGTLVEYTMNGTSIASGAVIANPGAGWAVAGTGDYNGDGKADILLHNDNGADVIWEMNGPAVIGGVSLGNPGANYTNAVAGIDLNGDGSSDLVLQNTASTLVGFTLNNNAQVTAGAVLGTPGAGWHAIGDNSTVFLDGTGSAMDLSGTPGADEFNLTSYVDGLHTVAGFNPAQDLIAFSSALFANYAAMQPHEVAYMGGTFIGLSQTAAVVIQGITPDQLNASNFVLR